MIPTTFITILIILIAVPLYFFVVPGLAIFFHSQRWDDEHPHAGTMTKVAHGYERYAYTDQDYRGAQIVYIGVVALAVMTIKLLEYVGGHARRAVCFVLCCGWCCCLRRSEPAADVAV